MNEAEWLYNVAQGEPIIFKDGRFTVKEDSPTYKFLNDLNMSRSTTPKLTKELFTGIHLVAITEARPHEGNAVIKFSDGQNKSFEKVYDFTSSEFLKMCYSANTIKDNSIFDATKDTGDIGKRLWICIKEVWIDADTVHFELFDTLLYNEGASVPPNVKGNPQDNKGVASGVFKEGPIWIPMEGKLNDKVDRHGIKGLNPKKILDDSFDLPDPKGIINTIPKPNHIIIAEQREMIKKVESGVKPIIEDEDSM